MLDQPDPKFSAGNGKYECQTLADLSALPYHRVDPAVFDQYDRTYPAPEYQEPPAPPSGLKVFLWRIWYEKLDSVMFALAFALTLVFWGWYMVETNAEDPECTVTAETVTTVPENWRDQVVTATNVSMIPANTPVEVMRAYKQSPSYPRCHFMIRDADGHVAVAYNEQLTYPSALR